LVDPKKRLKSVALETLVRVQALLPGKDPLDWRVHHAAVWREGPFGGELRAHPDVDAIDLDDLLFVDRQKALLERNTRQFAAGLPANNVLLWGARGTGKSSLIHGLLNRYAVEGLRLLEVDKEALSALPEIADRVRDQPFRFIVVCDDLSFESDDSSYKALKSVLEGSVFRASENILIYATSNRRHLLPEYMEDNLSARHVDGELHQGEAVEEKISLSDRFGIWLSFHPFKQDAYLDVVTHWLARIGNDHGLEISLDDEARAQALQWALARGARNGRTAQYFARDWVGQKLLQRQSD
jgi:predicted AAA+ superfamily ATPase